MSFDFVKQIASIGNMEHELRKDRGIKVKAPKKPTKKLSEWRAEIEAELISLHRRVGDLEHGGG